MKFFNRFFWLAPAVVLIAGCAAPESGDATYAEWQREELLPPTGAQTTQIYSVPGSYPATEPSIVVPSDNRRNTAGDLALADAIRREIEYDRGLAPSLRNVTIEVRDGRVILRGSVRSDLDSRVIMDDLRNVEGVTRITNNLEINPNTN
jgi:hypothetical protein